MQLNLDSPLINFGKALVYGAAWCAAAGITVLTDEALFAGWNGDNSFQVHLDWNVMLQPYQLLTGYYTGMQTWYVFGAWMVIAAYVTFGSMKDMIRNGIFDESASTFCICAIIFDSFGTWNFLRHIPWYYAFLFTILVTFTLIKAGKACLRLIAKGMKEMGEG